MDDQGPGSLLGWSEAARLLGVTERQVRHLWATGQLGGVRVGRHVRFQVADIDAFIAAHARPPAPGATQRKTARGGTV
jgi:excisionase family DNA binding protein